MVDGTYCANNNGVLALVWESSRFCLYRPGLRFIACLLLKFLYDLQALFPFIFFANVLPLHRENRGRCSERSNGHTADLCLQE